jgi:transposase
METVLNIQKENELLRQKLAEKSHHILTFEEIIKKFQRKVFGPSSEKSCAGQLGLFNEVEALECSEEQDDSPTAIDVKPHQRVKRPRVSIPKDYPRENIIHDLPESDKACPHDGTTLEQVGSVDHEQLDVIPAQIKVLRHRRLKYACPYCKQHIVTAIKPALPIEKASPAQACSLLLLLKNIETHYPCIDKVKYLSASVLRPNKLKQFIQMAEWRALVDAIPQNFWVHIGKQTVYRYLVK